jgi:Tyrosine phosphatase family
MLCCCYVDDEDFFVYHNLECSVGCKIISFFLGSSIPSQHHPSLSIIQMKKSKKLDKTKVPPDNFGLVEAGVYRSAMPTPKHFDFVSDSLHLKTILFLSQELPTL